MQDNIIGVFLVGSYARNAAQASSDLDLVILTDNVEIYLKDSTWAEKFGIITNVLDEDWGLLKTKRVYYNTGLEVEFNFTTSEWLKSPTDEQTKKVLADGYVILVDKTGALKAFVSQLGL